MPSYLSHSQRKAKYGDKYNYATSKAMFNTQWTYMFVGKRLDVVYKIFHITD